MRTARLLWAAAAALLATACATTMVSSTQGEPEPKGPVLRLGEGHFSRDNKSFRYWDKEKAVPAVCARCHTPNGMAAYLRDGKNEAAPHAKNGLACTNCHSNLETYERHAVARVTFPGGATVDSGDNSMNMCMTCHQGRESTASVNKATAGMPPDTPNPKLAFVHVHYFPAGATVFGTEAKVAFEYAGKAYAGRFRHSSGAGSRTCIDCHDAHGGEVDAKSCAGSGCHQGVQTLADARNVRRAKGDWDGNGREEGVAKEVATLHEALYKAIQAYARNVGGRGIAFTPEAFPYWHADLNGNGVVDADERRPNNPYTAFTPRLSQAIFNWTYVQRDPGAAYHNPRYTLQILHDSLASLAESGQAGVSMQGRVRP
jgi:hypothetical protein